MTTVDLAIPILNEEDTLTEKVEEALAHIRSMQAAACDVRVVIADNGSTDRSEELARILEGKYDEVRYLKVGRRGVGLALKTAWTSSEADIVGYMDLDLATDLRHLEEALSALLVDGHDVVTGSRLLPGSKVVGRSAKRGFTSRVFNFLVGTYFGTQFSDGMCGFKFLWQKHVQSLIDAGATSDGWFFATEILVCAEHLGLSVADLPVTWTDDPNSKVKIGKLSLEYLGAMRALKSRLAETSV